jgi:hypothetical protein
LQVTPRIVFPSGTGPGLLGGECRSLSAVGVGLGGGYTIPFTGCAVLCLLGWLPLANVHRAR